MASDVDLKLDVCGVCCPLPLIQLAKTVKGLAQGKLFDVIGNDPIFEPSVRDFCQANGHDIVSVTHADDRRVTVRIRVGGGS
jgi:tRNA 2-thiouridine synthesizing protein A